MSSPRSSSRLAFASSRTTKIPLTGRMSPATSSSPESAWFSLLFLEHSLQHVRKYNSHLNLLTLSRLRLAPSWIHVSQDSCRWINLFLNCISRSCHTLLSHDFLLTHTGSSTHVPGYHKVYDEIKSSGIDEVYCLSVNDAFVMRQWGLKLGLPEDKTIDANGFETVKLIPDGAALFTRGMGMACVWDQERGFGERSWRYSMVVNDKVIEKLFIEGGGVTQDSGPDPFEVSDAGTMLEYLKESKKE